MPIRIHSEILWWLFGGHEHLLQPASSASLANNQSFAPQRSLGFSRSIDEAEPLDLALAL
jgi:hypothetical protein